MINQKPKAKIPRKRVAHLPEQAPAHVCPEPNVAEIRHEAFADVLAIILKRQQVLRAKSWPWSWQLASRVSEGDEIKREIIALSR